MVRPKGVDADPPTWPGTGLLTLGSLAIAAGLATRIVISVDR
jgi:hypothetical protein